MGYAGQVSLGQAAFVGMGAYSAAQLSEWIPFPGPLIGAIVIGALVATLVGLPSLRIKGLQVAATTLAFGVMAGGVIFARPWSASSASGMAINRPSALSSNETFAFVVWGMLALVVVVDWLLRQGRLGRAFTAVRDREENAAAWGIPVGRTKLAAYAVSGAYAGLAGSLYAYLLQRVTPDPFDVWASLGFIAAAVIGGRGSLAGVAIAEGVLTLAPELMRSLQWWAPFIGAVALVAVPTLKPEGIGWLLDRPISVLNFVKRRKERQLSFGREGVLRYERGTDGAPQAVLESSKIRPIGLSVPARTVLEVSGVSVRFGGLDALSQVDLTVRRHETVGLIGPNGAGKTTLFNCISGFVRPTEGSVRYRGREMLGLPTHIRQGLGLARTFQHPGLCMPQSVRQNMLIAQHPYAHGGTLGAVASVSPSSGRSDVAKRAEEALALVGLAHVSDAIVGELPHVQQRLVEIAAGLASGPELLLLDEPAAGLSPEEADAFVERLRSLREELGLTILLIEHHLPVVTRLSHHIYALAEGRVLAEGSPEEIQANEAVIDVYIGKRSAKEASYAGG
jgi:branched-chain amino acid transport system permease protein